jgi:hypothetical protein
VLHVLVPPKLGLPQQSSSVRQLPPEFEQAHVGPFSLPGPQVPEQQSPPPLHEPPAVLQVLGLGPEQPTPTRTKHAAERTLMKTSRRGAFTTSPCLW